MSKNVYSGDKIIQYSSLMACTPPLKLSMVLGKAVPYSDGNWEEGPLVEKSSSIGYQIPHVMASMI